MNEKIKMVCELLIVGIIVLGAYALPLKVFYLSVLHYGFISWQTLLSGFMTILLVTILSNSLKGMWDKA